MAEPKKPPTTDEFQQLLPHDPARDAIHAEYGFHWQRWLTLSLLLKLNPGEGLWIEWGEDVSISADGKALTVQAKGLTKPISLGREKVLQIVARAFERDAAVKTVLWTSASIGAERGRPFGEPGIVHWRRIVNGEVAPDRLKGFLSAKKRLTERAAAILNAASAQDLLALLARVEWITDEADIDGLRDRVKLQLEARLQVLGVSPAIATDAALYLYACIAQVGLLPPDKRRVTAGELDGFLLGYAERQRQSAAPELLASFNKDSIAALGQIGSTLNDLKADQKEHRDEILKKFSDIENRLSIDKNAAEEFAEQAETPRRAPGQIQSFERDLAARFTKALRQELFPEFAERRVFEDLADEALSPAADGVNQDLKRRILLRAARSAAVNGKLDLAEKFLEGAGKFSGSELACMAQARIAQAKGDISEALRLTRDEKSPDARSVFISILSSAGRAPEALEWLSDEQIGPDMLSPSGIHILAQIHLRSENFDGFLAVMQGVTETQCHEGPQLLIVRGAARLASVFSGTDRQTAFQGIPIGARFKEPVAASAELTQSLDLAIADLDRILALQKELELKVTVSTAERLRRWAELLHPQRKEAALLRLRQDLTEPSAAIPALQFAIAFDVPFDAAAISEALERRERLGGLKGEELIAAFSLALYSKDPATIADFITFRRDSLEETLDKAGVRAIHIEALINKGDISAAKELLAKVPDGLLDNRRTLLEAEIAKAEGGDPVAEHERVYHETQTTDALRALVQALADRGDRLATARRAVELYERTFDASDIRLAMRALSSLGQDNEFLALEAKYPTATSGDNELIRTHAGMLFKQGRFADAKRVLAALSSQGVEFRALDLEIAIAIESGAWENISAIVSVYLDPARNDDGLDLIRAANIAQAAGSGPVLELIDAAVKKSPKSAEVLIGAYMLVLAEGLEAKRPEHQEWFSRAVGLSGEDGPVKQFELKDLLAEQRTWNERVQNINAQVYDSKLPLSVAAYGLRTTLVELQLGTLMRNACLADPRRRTIIPIFSGHRIPANTSDAASIAFDMSALLTLGWLKLLPSALKTYSRILIPADVMTELFEARHRIRRSQRSRIVDAKEVCNLIASSHLKICKSSPSEHSAEVGVRLAALLDAAMREGGVVVRPAPISKPGSFGDDANIDQFAGVLADTVRLLDVLVEHGALSEKQESTARKYLQMQDARWDSPARPHPDKPLYLDDLSISYLQHSGLLKAIVATFPNVFVNSEAEAEARALLANEAYLGEMMNVIDDVRAAIRSAIDSGAAVIGGNRGESEEIGSDSTLNLLHDLRGSDLVAIDDRSINREVFASDAGGHRARVVMTLDIVEEMTSRNFINASERLEARHSLRSAGAGLMPADIDELISAALRNRQGESAEFRAIRESFLIARMSELPRFPSDIMWFLTLALNIKSAIKEVWVRESDFERAAEASSALLALLPNTKFWGAFWENGPPPAWDDASDRAIMAGLAMPVELKDRAILDAYNAWLEKAVLCPIRLNQPDRYAGIVEQVKRYLLSTVDDHDEDAETH